VFQQAAGRQRGVCRRPAEAGAAQAGAVQRARCVAPRKRTVRQCGSVLVQASGRVRKGAGSARVKACGEGSVKRVASAVVRAVCLMSNGMSREV